MFLASTIIDSYIKFRLKSPGFRKLTFKNALNRSLRGTKFGRIMLRNLSDLMERDTNVHNEFIALVGMENFQKEFWESDLGYMWFEGNVSNKKSYFDSTIKLINEKRIESVLDIGCGWGVFCNKCVEETKVKRIHGIDISQGVIDNAKKKYTGERVLFEKKKIFDVSENYDLLSMFGSIDYVLPEQIQSFIAHMLKLANKNVVIVNSLRKIPLSDFNELTSSVKVMRYDIGYVHPLKYILENLKKDMIFTYSIQKSGIDSVLICIEK